MQLTTYLQRIGYRGSREPTFETLRTLHRAHLLCIPYENLDIHLGKDLPIDEAHFFRKLVLEKRGGWCYEMNGLFAWVLREMGFDVTLLAGAVGRPHLGEAAKGNHLCLLVRLDQLYFADVGFGDGIREPVPLREGAFEQDGFTYRLLRKGDYWYFVNHNYGEPVFDFTLMPHALIDFVHRCHQLQTSPDSGFVKYTVCHRVVPDGYLSLKGASLRHVTVAGTTERIIENGNDYAEVLRRHFDLTISGVESLWQTVHLRHQAWTAALPAE